MTDAAIALHWFTTDLRLADNPALPAAADGAVAGVFVLDPALLRRHATARKRLDFMAACLGSLDASLRERGSRLVVLEGDPADVLPPLAAALHAHVVTHATPLEPSARRRAALVAAALRRDGVAVRAAEAGLVQAAGSVRRSDGGVYEVYGAFLRAWGRLDLRDAAPPPARWLPSSALAGLGTVVPAGDPPREVATAGEAAAAARLHDFLRHGVAAYGDRRDVLGLDGTSRLSPHFRWGTLSAVAAVRAARAAAARDPRRRDGVEAWIRELAWRDFYGHLLVAEPRLAHEALRPMPVAFRDSDADFRRWQDGSTGVPLVDAGMRQLRQTGWMHNRARMIVASFLTKHLLLDWRLGEAHFRAELLDGQASQNGGGWQWTAGCGADAQPFYRIFSPLRQGERFDRDGAYVRRWVPELERVPAPAIHQPWTLPAAERRALAPGYPPPIVALDEGRARALAAYEQARAAAR